MLNSDPPHHTALRGLASTAFTPGAVAQLEPRIRLVAEELLAPIAGKTTFDVVRTLAAPLPVITIAEMLGIPTEDHWSFKRWSDSITSLDEKTSPEHVAHAQSSALELRSYLRQVVDARRAAPREDLISRFVQAMEDNEWFGPDALVDMCILLMVSGSKTTTNLISSAVLALACAPVQRSRLVEDPALLPGAVEEFLRFDGPVQIDPRVATREVLVGETAISAGSKVLVMLAAANRDPARFENPATLDVARTENPHIAFGRGIHYCLGGPLARLEGRIAIEALLRRFPCFGLAGGNGALEYGPSFILRGLDRLDIVRTV
jgi:cytochrome P450